jgi:acetoin utilization deacetylase AcuC-like enzyme
MVGAFAIRRAMMAKTGFVFEELYMWHDTGYGAEFFSPSLTIEPGLTHSENSATKRRFRNLLDVAGVLPHLTAVRATPVDEGQLARFHTRDYIASIKELSAARGGDAGELTPFGPGSYEIACLSAGGAVAALEAILAGEIKNAYALVRPPGHHAERDRGRGFCIFGNVAVAIMHGQVAKGLGRVAVVDWDVHHGNGTQQAFYDRNDVLTISLHQDNFYPAQSGYITDCGEGSGEGANINIPLPPGSGIGAYLAAFDRVVIPALTRFKPELIVVASGFDAGAIDPLGRMMIHSEGYRQMTARLMEAAELLCQGRLLLSHEGGYSGAHVPYCGLAVMEQLTGLRSPIEDPFMAFMAGWGYQDLQVHQDAVISAAAKLVAHVPG